MLHGCVSLPAQENASQCHALALADARVGTQWWRHLKNLNRVDLQEALQQEDEMRWHTDDAMWRRRWARTSCVEERRPDPIDEVACSRPLLSEIAEVAREDLHVSQSVTIEGSERLAHEAQHGPDAGLEGQQEAAPGAVPQGTTRQNDLQRDQTVINTAASVPHAMRSLSSAAVAGITSAMNTEQSRVAGPLAMDPPSVPVLRRGVSGSYVVPAGQ